MTEALWASAGNHPIRKKHHGQIMPILTLIREPLGKTWGHSYLFRDVGKQVARKRSEWIGVGHEITSHRSILSLARQSSHEPDRKFRLRMIHITQALLKDHRYCIGLASLAGLVCDRKVDTASDGGDRRSIEI